MKETEQVSEFMELEEAAAFVRLGKTTLRLSDCTRIKVGRRVVFHIDDLRRFMMTRRKLSAEDAA